MSNTRDNQRVDHILSRIRQVRGTIRRTVLEIRLARLLSIVIPCFVAVAIIDFMLRLPEGVRWFILGCALIAIFLDVRRRIWPAIRFNPSLVDVALRIESRFPSLVGRLASGVDFARMPDSDRNPMVVRSLVDLDHRASNHDFRGVVEKGPAHKMAALAVLLILAITSFAFLRPVDASIATRRILAPWMSVNWPARTELVSATSDDLVHARGEPLTLAVDLVKGDPETDRVTVRLRTIRGDEIGSWRNLVLTRQQGQRFERVVDTDADRIEYEFSTSDFTTDLSMIRIVPAPTVLESKVVVTPPDYAQRLGVLKADLGPGTDRRSRLPRAVLEGSSAGLELKLSREIPVPRLENGSIDPGFISETIISRTGNATLTIDPEDATSWIIGWPLGQGGDLEIKLRDENDLSNLDPIRYRIDTVADRRPSTTIVDPAADRTVSVRAIIPIQADARDDVGLSEFAIEASIGREETPSRVERIVELDVLESDDGNPIADASIERDFDVASFEPTVGDVIKVVAIARDEWVGPDGPREAVRSEVRKLRVVSDLDLVEQLQGALGSVRRSAIRIEGDQAELTDRVRETGSDRSMTREQDRIGDRIEGVREAIEEIQDRRDENRIEDDLLADVLDQAAEILEVAENSADRALAQLDQASQERTTASDPSTEASAREEAEQNAEQAEQEAIEAQQEVRDELTDLAAALDRGEDAWVVSRRIERLAEDLETIQERTGNLSEQTMGRDRDELSPEERRELDDIARDQGDLADRAEDLLDELDARAEAMEMADPTEAEGLRQAAEEARQEGLEEEMREAEDRARQNQLEQAAQAQQRAAEALERMQETIEESRKAVVEELRRRMESLVDSLKGLLEASEDEVIALSRVIAEDPDPQAVAERAEAMIGLQRNTMAVAGEASVADERIGRIVSRAADNQSAAIRDLRDQPPDLNEARASEDRGVAALREALELAEEAAEELAEQQADEQREKLLAAYREILDLQTGVRLETGDLVDVADGKLNRRQLIKSRRLAKGETEVGNAVEAVADEFVEVSDSLVFSMTHRNLDAWIAEAADLLRDGDVSQGVVERQIMVMGALAGLIEALAQEGAPDDDPFGQQDQGGQAGGGQSGGQGGPQPLIPPIAELKMLRSMQIQILEATRRIDLEAVDQVDRDARLADIARIQSDLHGVANALVNTMQPAPAADEAGEKRESDSRPDADESKEDPGDES